MQVMPPTGKELNVGDITKLEPNIHAGVKYMRFMIDQYYKDEPMDDLNKALMTFASYNAGPGRIRQLRRETEKRGLESQRVVRQRRAHRLRNASAARPSPTSATSSSTTGLSPDWISGAPRGRQGDRRDTQ
jgi:membrane-bound lytic murein transglycosylase MltF